MALRLTSILIADADLDWSSHGLAHVRYGIQDGRCTGRLIWWLNLPSQVRNPTQGPGEHRFAPLSCGLLGLLSLPWQHFATSGRAPTFPVLCNPLVKSMEHLTSFDPGFWLRNSLVRYFSLNMHFPLPAKRQLNEWRMVSQ